MLLGCQCGLLVPGHDAYRRLQGTSTRSQRTSEKAFRLPGMLQSTRRAFLRSRVSKQCKRGIRPIGAGSAPPDQPSTCTEHLNWISKANAMTRGAAGPPHTIFDVSTSRDLVEVWLARPLERLTFLAPASLPRFTPALNCRSTLPMSPRGALAPIRVHSQAEQLRRVSRHATCKPPGAGTASHRARA